MPHVVDSACHHLHGQDRQLCKLFAGPFRLACADLVKILACAHAPVVQKNPVQPGRRLAADHHVGVAPEPQRSPAQVFVAQVEAAGESRAPVDDSDLSVVAVVHLTPEERKSHRHELVAFGPRVRKRLEELSAQPPTADRVAKHPHAHSAFGRGRQQIAHLAADDVVVDNEIFHVNVGFGRSQFAFERSEGGLAVYEHLEPVAHRQVGSARRMQQSADQESFVRRERRTVGGRLGRLKEPAVAEVVHVRAYHYVEQHAYDRHKDQRQQPQDGAVRILPLSEDYPADDAGVEHGEMPGIGLGRHPEGMQLGRKARMQREPLLDGIDHRLVPEVEQRRHQPRQECRRSQKQNQPARLSHSQSPFTLYSLYMICRLEALCVGFLAASRFILFLA